MVKHLVGHCNGESLWLKNDLVDGTLIGTCSGCGLLIPEEDDPHEICVADGHI